MARPRRVELSGSERTPLAGAVAVGPAPAAERLEVTVRLRPRAALPELAADHAGVPLTRTELVERHGAQPRDVAAVEAFAGEHALEVVSAHAGRRSVVLAGSTAALSRAFGVELERYEHAGGAYRGRVGPLHLPPALASAVEGVFGLDDRPQAQPHFRRRAARRPVRRREARGGFTPPQVARLYGFPAHLDGGGETIAILEVSGGYRRDDLDAYFATLHLPVPRIVDVSVDGAGNAPVGDPDSDDSEVLLDLEVAGAVAPGARLAVYWAPNTERGFIDALTEVVHDTALRPSALSVSWGSAETTWTRQAVHALDGLCHAAALVGLTVLAASGDNGSHDGVHDGRAHVDFPASSPHVLACGGTRLHLHRDGALATENAWNDGPHEGATGGGISEVFAVPPWQSRAALPPCANPPHRSGRGVPDVSADADPETGYCVRVDGEDSVIGGTSAAAPLWAGLIALANQRHGQPVGFVTPILYGAALRDGALRDVPTGSNGAYQAREGWDCCTGLGTPRAAELIEVLAGPPG